MSMDLWVETYRPKTLDEYVWRDDEQRKQVEKWIADGALPHVMFTGTPGSGKTSLAKLLLRELGVNSGDILEINASRERNADVVQTKIISFCSTWPIGTMKYVLLDEADSMSPLAQRILRGEMETYHDSVRFILTGNYANKFIPAIHSRCQGFHFESLDVSEFQRRVLEILVAEHVEFETEEDLEILNEYIEKTHPDLRKCINLVQQNVMDGRLTRIGNSDSATKDYFLEMADLFKAGQYTEARKLIVGQASPEEYEEIYRFFYSNLELWGSDPSVQDEAILVIRRGLVNHGMVSDVEINLAATIIELAALNK